MRKRRYAGSMAKKVLAGLLTVAAVVSNGYGLFPAPVEAEAASTGVLSGTERNVIFANSRTDFRDESIYFAMVTRYYNGDESNDVQCWDGTQYNLNDPAWRGDFKGLIEKLDYIKALGFTAIWITPVVKNCSGYDYHGYHAINFSEVDERYESDDCTYQDLIDACHAKGMKIIQDVVFNHTGNFGEENLLPMFTKEGDLSSTDCLKQLPNSGLPANYDSLTPGQQYDARLALMKNTDGQNHDVNNIYHHYGNFNWDDYTCQLAQIAGDCVDLNTENPIVYNYLVDAYKKYIDMGVDGFRVDTVRHISRLTFNKVFNDAFKEAGRENGKDFFMFGEVCTRDNGNYWYRQSPSMSTPYYTWKESKDYAWSDTDWEVNYNSAIQSTRDNADNISEQPTSQNALLQGNEYHTPDYSQFSGLNVIDFPMHWSFKSADSAFAVARNGDRYYNDATWNVTYVDSHDYAPDGAPEDKRFDQDQSTWAENLALMFTFRGIPCIYYGTETEFQKGQPIDKGPNIALADSGRAYYGDNIEGTITAVDFGEYGNVSGAVGNTLKHPLSQHIQRLNRIRQAVPALRKGQYSTEGVSGSLAFKRRYTDDTTDSFVCVSISGNATFTGIPNGKYVDAVTGDVKNVTNGTLSISVSGKGNLKAYVLDTAKTPAPGRVITNGKYLTDGGAIQDIEPIEIDIVAPTGITVSKTSVSLMEGTTDRVTATVAPSNATNKVVTWTSNNPSVATVAGGTITGISPGSATITAKTSNGLTAMIQVTVTENPNIIQPTGITISDNSLTLTEGETGTLTATVLPSNATNKAVTWTSADTSIATVSSIGKVTAVSEGTTAITASTINGYTVSATIIVEPKEIPIIENGIYFEKPSNWSSNINAYFYSSATNSTVGAEWPGTPMTDLGDGIFGLSYQSSDSNLMVVFNDGSSQTADLQFVNNGYYSAVGFVKVVEPQEEKGKVIVNYTDESGNILSSQIIKGKIGTTYETTPKTFDNYILKITPANASGTYTQEDITVTYVYKKNVVIEELKVTGRTSASSVTVGTRVVITGTAAGGNGNYTYSYLIHNKDTDAWSRLTPSFVSSNTYTWTAGSAGNREFFVEVKDSTGTVVRSSAISVQVADAVNPLEITGKTSASNVTVGTKVVITGIAAGGSGSYTYSYLIHNKNTNAWSRLTPSFVRSNTYTWTAGSTGNREFYVEVKDSTGKVVRSSAIGVQVTAASKPLAITGKTSAANVTVGTKVVITGTATGGSGNYTYSYLIHNKDTNAWTRLTSTFKNSNTYTWTAGSAGNREFFVEVKDGTGKVVRSSALGVKVISASKPLSITGKANAADVSVGTKVVITGTAAGGSGNYTYSYLIHNKDTNAWSRLTPSFVSSNTYTWTAGSAGNREFYVEVKDSTGKVVRSSAVNVQVAETGVPELSAAGAASATQIGVETTILITAAAAGGSGNYTYSFIMHNKDTGDWYRFSDFKTSNKLSWTAGSAGNRDFYVEVKDSTGKIVRSEAVNVRVTE